MPKKNIPASKKEAPPKGRAGQHSAKRAPLRKPAAKPSRKKADTAVKAKQATAQPVDHDADTASEGGLCGLSVRAALCIDIYLATMNAGQAYIEAGYTAKTRQVAQVCASQLLSSPKGRAYLAKRAKAMFDRVEEEQDRLLQAFSFTAYADPRELVEHYRGACRYCHGKMNRFQYTAGEWDKIMSDYVEKQEEAAAKELPLPREPDPKGGVGFNRRADPSQDCTECGGDGEGRTVVKDTRHLSPAALALYAGVKEGKDGIEVKMHSQEKARETIAKIRKMFEDNAVINVTFDPAELEEKFGKSMRAAHERMAQMRTERLGQADERPSEG